MTGVDQSRTLLAALVASSDRTHEEHVADFNALAGKLGESATLSLRQFDRWLAGDLITMPRPTCRRVAEALWGRPIKDLLGPVPRCEVDGSPVAPAPTTDTGPVEEGDDMERRTVVRTVVTAAGIGLGAPTLAAVEQVRRAMDGALDSSNVGRTTIERWERTAYEYAGCQLAVTTIAGAPDHHRSGLITHYCRAFYNGLTQAVRDLPAARELREVLAAQP